MNVALRYVGLVDTANWVKVRRVRDTDWHEFHATGPMKKMAVDDLPERNADSIKKAFPRCKIMEQGVGATADGNGADPDDFWYVRFKLNEQTLSKLPV